MGSAGSVGSEAWGTRVEEVVSGWKERGGVRRSGQKGRAEGQVKEAASSALFNDLRGWKSESVILTSFWVHVLNQCNSFLHKVEILRVVTPSPTSQISSRMRKW